MNMYSLEKWESVLMDELSNSIDIYKIGYMKCGEYGRLGGEGYIKIFKGGKNYTLCQGKIYVIYDSWDNIRDKLDNIFKDLKKENNWNQEKVEVIGEDSINCYFLDYMK